VATGPSLDSTFTPLTGEPRPLREWLTTFHFASVVIDPYTHESAWILSTAARVMRQFSGAATRVNFVVTAPADDARRFLGPLADEFLVFLDPDRSLTKQMGIGRLPAFVFLRIDGTVQAKAEGWNPAEWRTVAKEIATAVQWSVPHIPAAGDPGAFAGSPV
jgi:hypothetical protein